MPEPDRSLERYVHIPEIVHFPLAVPSAEDLQAQRKRQNILDWLEGMSRPESPEEVAADQERDFKDPVLLYRRRPTRSGEAPPINVTGMERLVQMFWGDELLEMSVVFIAGKQRFAEVVPVDLTPDFLRERTSPATEHALYVMCVSSLYWAQVEKDIDQLEARSKASDIVWAFRLNSMGQNFVTGDWVDDLKEALADYHGKYSGSEPDDFDDSYAIQAARRVLRNHPVKVLPLLRSWLMKPRALPSYFRIRSRFPLEALDGRSTEQDRPKYISFY